MPPNHLQCEHCASRGSGVFCDLDPAHLKALSAAKTTNQYKAHQVIFYEGNRPFGLFCINAGKVKLVKADDTGDQQIVRLAGPGDIIGYRCLLVREPYSATAETIETSQICFIDQKTFRHIIETHPATALRVMQRLASELRHAEDHLMHMAKRSIRERLAEFFLLLRTRYGEDTAQGVALHLNLSRAEWAELIGTTQESLIRLFSDFRKEGLITVEGRKVWLRDVKALAEIARLVD